MKTKHFEWTDWVKASSNSNVKGYTVIGINWVTGESETWYENTKGEKIAEEQII